ncbi:soluble guanylate cyclase 88E-like isoform X1 [Tigriopus californicus]|nr:soluble guanylate cyclase 88E-like isoform X1 [Tigriopus californicus]
MYGLLLQNMAEYIIKVYGDKQWQEIKTSLKIDRNEFATGDTFPEGQLIKMGKKALQVLQIKDEEFYEGMGVYFIELTRNLGYGVFLQNLGRYIRDFLLNLDNFHDYLKFTFPRMKAPSFFVEDETEKSIKLQYRSKRRGFHYYVQGQIKEISKKYFGHRMDIQLKKQEVVFDTVICTFDLFFDNSPYSEWIQTGVERKESSLPIRAAMIFEMFPFCILFQKDLTVTCMGVALQQVIPGIVGKRITSYFELVKPLIEFKFDTIQTRTNNMFELATSEEIDKLGKSAKSSGSGRFTDEIFLGEDVDKTLHIKGQMIFIQEWQQMLFLACPMMNALNNLVWTGLFVNDLSMHDYSRDIMLATSQEQIEMRMALNAAEVKANALNTQLKKLDEIQQKTDELLYQMIPKSIADRLRKGEDTMSTCEVFSSVTMLFSDIVGFTTICSRLEPAQVVVFLNNLYTLFDFLVDQNSVYKVETIGDAYLIVSGCPVKSTNHALKICDMAFDMMDGIAVMKDPGTGQAVEMRIGCHTGSVVAGIVGLKMPRYCLFGLNVALTEKLESNSKPMRIHISQPCKDLLPPQYRTELREDPEVTQKVGGMNSYFLTTKDGRKTLKADVLKALMPTDAELPKLEGHGQSGVEPNAQGDNPDGAADNGGEEDAGDDEDSGMDDRESLFAAGFEGRRVSTAQGPYCGGFQNSGVCTIV